MKALTVFCVNDVTCFFSQDVIEKTVQRAGERLSQYTFITSRLNLKYLGGIFQYYRSGVEPFTRKTCDLSGKMVIHNPMMILATKDNYEVYNPEIQEFIFRRASFIQQCCEPSDIIVQYMEPSMYHGDKLMVKARVTAVPVKSEKKS